LIRRLRTIFKRSLFNLSDKPWDALYQKIMAGARIVAGGGNQGFYEAVKDRLFLKWNQRRMRRTVTIAMIRRGM
jgi:hypothetical protein